MQLFLSGNILFLSIFFISFQNHSQKLTTRCAAYFMLLVAIVICSQSLRYIAFVGRKLSCTCSKQELFLEFLLWEQRQDPICHTGDFYRSWYFSPILRPSLVFLGVGLICLIPTGRWIWNWVSKPFFYMKENITFYSVPFSLSAFFNRCLVNECPHDIYLGVLNIPKHWSGLALIKQWIDNCKLSFSDCLTGAGEALLNKFLGESNYTLISSCNALDWFLVKGCFIYSVRWQVLHTVHYLWSSYQTSLLSCRIV